MADQPTPSPKPSAGAPSPPRPPKPEDLLKPVPLDSELLKRLRERFADAIGEAILDRKQAIIKVSSAPLLEICRYLRDDEKFDFLTDLTALDCPKRERRFDVVYNLYSFPKNERLRLKAEVAVSQKIASVASVWGAANWLERECFDMFGIVFDGHPHLKRILLPDEWQGHPLRKDYDILKQDTDWVRENLHIESGQAPSRTEDP